MSVFALVYLLTGLLPIGGHGHCADVGDESFHVLWVHVGQRHPALHHLNSVVAEQVFEHGGRKDGSGPSEFRGGDGTAQASDPVAGLAGVALVNSSGHAGRAG